jgi:hypothetical protein
MSSTPTLQRFWRDLAVAGFLLATAAVLAFLTPDHISPGLAQRIIGVVMGLFVVVYANAVPKRLPRSLATRCATSAGQDLRRFTAWTMVIGGFGYAIASLVAPIDHAVLIAAILLGAALLLVVGRVAWALARGPRP